MKVLFICSGNHPIFKVAPFVQSQAESLEHCGVEINFFTIRGKGLKGYLRHVKPLRREIIRGKYDLVHAHYTFCGWIARMASWRIPLVVSYMGSDTYGAVNMKGRRKLKSSFMIAQGILLNFFANAIIVKSPNLKRMILLKRKATVIPNGVDFERFKPVPAQDALTHLSLDPEKRYILFMGDPADSRKNYTLAEEATNIVSCRWNVSLLAPYPVPPTEVPWYLNAANLLLLTSWKEGSPNVVKEAMACNCPVIATPAGDAADTLAGADHCYVTGYHATEIAEKIEVILAAGTRSNGREKIVHLNEKVIAGKILAVYQKILKAK